MNSADALTGFLLCLILLIGLWFWQKETKVLKQARRVETLRNTLRKQAVLEDSNPNLRGPSNWVGEPLGKRGWLAGRGIERENQRLLSTLCTEVSSRLKAGSSATDAWLRSWSRLTGQREPVFDVFGVPEEINQMRGESAKMVAAATRLSSLTGAPLADMLDQCAQSIADLEQAQSAQRLAFAGPRMSAKVLSVLPVVGLFGAGLLGANPIAWFLSGPVQICLGLAGVGLAVSGNLVSSQMISKASEVGRESQRAPILCDLVAAGLRGGGSVPNVLKAVGEAMGDSEYDRVGAELQLGATWDEAWEPEPFGGALLRLALQPGWEEGVGPVLMLRQVANQTRSGVLSDSKEVAERLGVKLALPLGLLLLPAFVVLGLVPLFFSLIGQEVLVPFGVS